DQLSTRCLFIAIVVLALSAPDTLLGQGPGATRGDIVMEKYLAHEAARMSQNFFGGVRTLRENEVLNTTWLKQEFPEMVGLWPLPEKTPLKATVTGTIEREAFVVEKLHFQSRPGLYVTANLYRPKLAAGRLPAVVLFMGHYNRGRNGHKVFLQDQG